MDKILKLKKKINQIENILKTIKEELETLEIQNNQPAIETKENNFSVSDDELKAEHTRLYEEFKNKNFKAIEEFIRNKNKEYLKHFCRVNNFPLDTSRSSKSEILKQIKQWFAQREAITKKTV